MPVPTGSSPHLSWAIWKPVAHGIAVSIAGLVVATALAFALAGVWRQVVGA